MQGLRALILLVCALIAVPLAAQEAPIAAPGQVQIPLDVYNSLVDQARTPEKPQSPLPAGWSLGEATMSVEVMEHSGRASAKVNVTLGMEVLDDDWVLIPLLPSGTAVSGATLDGKRLQLIPSPLGLAWGTQAKGNHTITLTYQVDAHRSEGGFTAPIPTPQAASINLMATLPGQGIDASVIPAAGVNSQPSGENTRLIATIPTTAALQLTWRVPGLEGHTVSRARYSGSLMGDAIAFTASFGIEIFSDEPLNLPLFPQTTVLEDVLVDGKAAAIVTQDSWFATLVQGRGAHSVDVTFQVPINRDEGPPKMTMPIPEVPVSRFDITLPGKKEISVLPKANVTASEKGDSTLSTFFVPLSNQVVVSWSEAIPEAIKTEVRANASLYHLTHAEEGVLYVRAMALWDVTRGETSTLDLLIPQGAQINRIVGADGSVSDWRVTSGRGKEPDRVTAFLDRKVSGEYRFDIFYERLLGTGEAKETPVSVPLIQAADVHRQRGMVALLASKELAVKADVETGLNRVGENQLPAWVRQEVDKTIAHTFKYADLNVDLQVHAAPPERKQGRFDAQIDTLASIGDVTMKGSATVEVNVKSGTTMDITLGAPADVNVLSLAAPSLRTYKIETEPGGGQTIDVQFTQEMEGQFRIEVTYERIMTDGLAEVPVPTLTARGAEVEQGRIAVEALTAVEVQTAATQGLSTLDTSELPKQLILKTTNPILLAYKYVQSDTPSQLSLKVTRHNEIAVQDAIIDQAHYRTLYTPDGLAVTTARFMVRNSRKQFLKVQLPAGSEVWKAWVDGSEEKPALASDGDAAPGPNVLIKIINSVQGFPVDLIYTTPVSALGRLGTIKGQLPRPDMIATRSRWDVYLPDTLSYREPESNMRLMESRVYITKERMAQEIADGGTGKPMDDAMRIMVPTSGMRFSFEKLYANQSEDDATFSIPYASSDGATLALIISVLGAALTWLGLASLLLNLRSRQISLGALASGGIILAITLGTFEANPTGALVTSVAAVLIISYLWRQRSSHGGDSAPPAAWTPPGASPGVVGPTEAVNEEEGDEEDRGETAEREEH